MKTPALIRIIATALVATTLSAFAQVAGPPDQIDYQGRLLNSSNGPITSNGGPGTTGTAKNYEIRFRIWNEQSGGSLIWAEKQIVTVTGDGLFSVRIGEGEAITVADGDPAPLTGSVPAGPPGDLLAVFNGKECFLGITVMNPPSTPGEISPRLKFLASPFAMVAEKARFAEFGPTSGTFAVNNLRVNAGGLSLYNNSSNGAEMPMQAALLSNEIHGNSGEGTDAGQLRLSAGGETNVSNKAAIDLYGFDDNFIRFFTNGTERMRVVSGGKVGIGTTAPAGNLHVTGTETTQMTLGSASGVAFAVGNASAKYGLNFGVNGNGSSWIQGGRTDGSSTAYNISLQASGGNVGIGTTSPSQKLEVSGGYAVLNGLRLSGSDTANTIYQATGDMGINTAVASQSVKIGSNVGGTVLTVQNGRVGIGTTSPAVPLDVTGTIVYGASGSAATWFTSFSTTINRLTDATSNFAGVSIRASNFLVAGGVAAISDERIKNIKNISDSAEDLHTLLGIEVTDYTYRDVIEKGTRPQKKVIAQQVEKAFPQAVIQNTGVIPDIYEKAPVKDGWLKLTTNLKVGERVRLITEDGDQAVHEVRAVRKGAFLTDLRTDGKQVFVYGREVKDFRAVDYDAIAMLNVSATQELARKLEAKDNEVKALKARLAELEARDQARDAKLIAIEEMLAADKTAARTVSLKTTAAVK